MADKRPPQSAKELLRRYAEGEREFVEANLERANLMDANLVGVNLKRVNLIEANLERANLEGANLINASLVDASLVGANLRRAKLAGAKFARANLAGANLRGANLQGVDLEEADLEGADLMHADLEGADLVGANLEGANLINANLVDANLESANLQRARLVGADLEEANIYGADLWSANLRQANLEGANFQATDLRDTNLLRSNLDRVDFSGAAFNERTDLLVANWRTLVIGKKTYQREAVERGEEILPFGMGPKLSVIIEMVRQHGTSREAILSVVDYIGSAAPGIEAEVIDKSGGISIIRLSVGSREDAGILLQVGDGICRLLGVGKGIQILPQNGAIATKEDVDALEKRIDKHFDLAARRSNITAEQIIEELERTGRESVKSVKLSGFTDKQMEKLRSVVDEVSDVLEVKFIEESREAMMTLTQKVSRDVYEMKVAKPLRTLLEAVFSPGK
jgi:uncharacterized protein YjbI with pentapeptide repeats